MKSNAPPAANVQRSRFALAFWVALTLALFILMMGAPAWAASPVDWQQGTVPLPPSDPGGGGSGGSGGGSGSGGGNSAAATATPVLAAPVTQTVLISDALAFTMGVPANETGIVVAPRLNMRSGAGVSFPVVGRVVLSQTVTIQFRNAAGDWWYTCCGTDTTTSGWVSALYVRPTSFAAADAGSVLPIANTLPTGVTPVATPAAAPVVAPAGNVPRGAINVARLNLRDQPSTQGAVLGKLTLGQEVNVTARSADGNWWYICCLAATGATTGTTGTTGTSGWVSAAFVDPSFARADAATLLPLFSAVPTGVVLPTPTPRPGAGPTVTATVEPTTTLRLEITQEPEAAVPGSLVMLHFAVTNSGDVAATNVELRNELTPTLSLVGGEAGGKGLVRQNKTAAGRTVVAVTWPTVQSGAVVTATIALSIAADAPMGSIVDNIAAVAAQNAAAQTSGVRLGMPPTALPEFK